LDRGPPEPPQPAIDGFDGDGKAAVSEADIVQLPGDRLYVLSFLSGLTIIDASNPAALHSLGVYRTQAVPFAMYVEDGVVYALFNNWQSYGCDAPDLCARHEGSRMQALDTRDPAHVRVLADLELPGYVDGARRVGEVMYVVTEQSEDTSVTSFGLSDPSQFIQLDRLSVLSNYYAGSRRIAMNDQRVYVSGYEYDADHRMPPGDVRVVDISDPSGALVEGAQFQVAGPIQSGEQMDEFDGVLRVLSQPGGWGSGQRPLLETFRVSSSNDIQPLGSSTVQVPGSLELVQDVRFDGPRGYATLSLQQNPLLTFDLSDPGSPRQTAQLEMPGWVYHLEPRGNRLFVVGNDPRNPSGSLHLSLFDVENLTQPVLLGRVAFGGDSGRVTEGHNQIHTPFSILPESGLILAPFHVDAHDAATCSDEHLSGVQLLDFTDTALTARGVAPLVGDARRTLLHSGELLGLSDNSVQSFDISNRDAPAELGQVAIARNVAGVHVLGDHMLRFGRDWTSQETVLDSTTLVRASESDPEARIDLSALFEGDSACDANWSWGRQVFSRGDYAYVARYGYARDPQNGAAQQLTLYVLDVRDPDAPKAMGRLPLEPLSGDAYFTDIVQTDNALLVGRLKQLSASYSDPTAGVSPPIPSLSYDVIELGDPGAPTVASRFEIPPLLATGGWGSTGIENYSVDMGWGWSSGGGDAELTYGDLVISQHYELVGGLPAGAKYYLDRLDVSDPYQPKLLSPINIPGTVLHYDGDTNQLITLDFSSQLEETSNQEDCYVRGYKGYFESTFGGCWVTRRTLNALVLEGDRAVRTSQVSIDAEQRTLSVAVSGNRIFYTTSDPPKFSPFGGFVGSPDASPISPITLETLQLVDGQLSRLPAQELHRVDNETSLSYSAELYARGERAFELSVQTLTVIDTLAPAAPTRLTHGLALWGCGSLEVAGDTAYCALDQGGVEAIDIGSTR